MCCPNHKLGNHKARWLGKGNGWYMVAKCPNCGFEDRRKARYHEIPRDKQTQQQR